MPLAFEFTLDSTGEHGMTLPYPPRTEGGRTNWGFEDLRGRPDQARKITEATCSPALQDLLAMMAAPDSDYFSLGCDTGGEQHEPNEAHAGGYIQFSYADPKLAQVTRIHRVRGEQLALHLESKADDHHWGVELELIPVWLEQIGGPKVCWSYRVNYTAVAPTLAQAQASREELTRAIAEHFRENVG